MTALYIFFCLFLFSEKWIIIIQRLTIRRFDGVHILFWGGLVFVSSSEFVLCSFYFIGFSWKLAFIFLCSYLLSLLYIYVGFFLFLYFIAVILYTVISFEYCLLIKMWCTADTLPFIVVQIRYYNYYYVCNHFLRTLFCNNKPMLALS